MREYLTANIGFNNITNIIHSIERKQKSLLYSMCQPTNCYLFLCAKTKSYFIPLYAIGKQPKFHTNIMTTILDIQILYCKFLQYYIYKYISTKEVSDLKNTKQFVYTLNWEH